MNQDEPIYSTESPMRNLNGLPPDQVRIRGINIEPWPDGKRIRVGVTLTPFEKQPNLELSLYNSQGIEIANAMIIETMLPKLVITLHIREADPSGKYRLLGKLSYADLGVTQEMENEFTISNAQNDQV
jgi:hypothetical protein